MILLRLAVVVAIAAVLWFGSAPASGWLVGDPAKADRGERVAARVVGACVILGGAYGAVMAAVVGYFIFGWVISG